MTRTRRALPSVPVDVGVVAGDGEKTYVMKNEFVVLLNRAFGADRQPPNQEQFSCSARPAFQPAEPSTITMSDPILPTPEMVHAYSAIRKLYGIPEFTSNPMLRASALNTEVKGKVGSDTVVSKNLGDLQKAFSDVQKNKSVEDALRVAHSRVKTGTATRSTELVMAAMHEAENNKKISRGSEKRKYVVDRLRGIQATRVADTAAPAAAPTTAVAAASGDAETKTVDEIVVSSDAVVLETGSGTRQFSDGIEIGEHLVSGAVALVDEGVIEFILSAIASAVGVDLDDEVKEIITKTTKVSTSACVRCCFPSRTPSTTA